MSYTLEDAAGLVEKYIEEHHLPTQVILAHIPSIQVK